MVGSFSSSHSKCLCFPFQKPTQLTPSIITFCASLIACVPAYLHTEILLGPPREHESRGGSDLASLIQHSVHLHGAVMNTSTWQTLPTVLYEFMNECLHNSTHIVDTQTLVRRNKNQNKTYTTSHYWLNSPTLIMSSCVEGKIWQINKLNNSSLF